LHYATPPFGYVNPFEIDSRTVKTVPYRFRFRACVSQAQTSRSLFIDLTIVSLINANSNEAKPKRNTRCRHACIPGKYRNSSGGKKQDAGNYKEAGL